MTIQIFLSAGAVVTLVVMAAAVREQQNNQQVEGIIQHLEEAVEPTPTPPPSVNEAVVTSPTPPITTPTPVLTRTSSPTASSQESKEVMSDIHIDFLNLPTTIQAGESFTVRWRLNGPSGPATGRTTLTAKYNVRSQDNGSSSSVNSSSTQSYGVHALPQTFSTDLTYGSMPGTITVEIEADINGRTIREARSVRIE